MYVYIYVYACIYSTSLSHARELSDVEVHPGEKVNLRGRGFQKSTRYYKSIIIRYHKSTIISQPGTRKVDVRLPGKGNSNSHGARPVHIIVTMMTWIRTSRLSMKNSLSQRAGKRV
jgi:hypothetical protein